MTFQTTALATELTAPWLSIAHSEVNPPFPRAAEYHRAFPNQSSSWLNTFIDSHPGPSLASLMSCVSPVPQRVLSACSGVARRYEVPWLRDRDLQGTNDTRLNRGRLVLRTMQQASGVRLPEAESLGLPGERSRTAQGQHCWVHLIALCSAAQGLSGSPAHLSGIVTHTGGEWPGRMADGPILPGVTSPVLKVIGLPAFSSPSVPPILAFWEKPILIITGT